MKDINAARAGVFRIGGDLAVVRLGLGTMRMTGPGVMGQPTWDHRMVETLHAARDAGMNLVDTSGSYAVDSAEDLVCGALRPYGEIRIATKGGYARSGPDTWSVHGDPDHLMRQARRSRERLGVERIDLWHLHRIDPKVPRDEQFEAVRRLMDEGVIRHAGLNDVSVEEIEAAGRWFPVSTVRSRYDLADRSGETVLDHCERERIGFIPAFPLAAGRLAGPGGPLERIARAHAASVFQIALAWLLQRSPVILPIFGARNPSHVAENAGAAGVTLSDADFRMLSR